MIEIHGPRIVFGQGRRANNEDNFTPDEYAETTAGRFFLVCDGMGGAEKGEIASEMAVRTFSAYAEAHPVTVPDGDYLTGALKAVEAAFDAYLEGAPMAMGMGTTLALLWFHERGITIGHIGDSRVYRFRDGAATPLTKDHSMVGELLAAGILTEQEAANHPRKNVITRAIVGSYRGGTTMEVQVSEDVQAGDIFMLCTDGITEACPTYILEELYAVHRDVEHLTAAISAACEADSRDNYTALLVKVAAVSGLERPRADHSETSLLGKWGRHLKSYFAGSADKKDPGLSGQL